MAIETKTIYYEKGGEKEHPGADSVKWHAPSGTLQLIIPLDPGGTRVTVGP